MAFEEIREYFKRHVLRRVKVFSSDAFLFDPPEIFTLRKSVETYPVRASVKVSSSKLLEFHGHLECSTGGFRFSEELAKVHGDKIRRYAKHQLKIHKMKKMKKAYTRVALNRILAFPHERENRLKWLKKRPTPVPGEMILAWYGPIVEGAVLKLALNKQRGTLLIWYNHRSRHFRARGVFLYRRLGMSDKPEWRWA